MRAAAVVLVVTMACAVPKRGMPRHDAYSSNGASLAIGGLLALPPVGLLAVNGECGECGVPLILGSILLLAGTIGMIATASGTTCDPDAKTGPWTCAD